MKRVLIVLAIFVLIVGGYAIVVRGFSNENLGINIVSYAEIQDESDALTISLASYNTKNTNEYESAKANLVNAIKNYNTSKKAYEDLIEEIGYTGEEENTEEEKVEEKIVYANVKAYRIDYLLTTLGTYSTKEGLTSLKFDLETGSTSNSEVSTLGYKFCNLKFTVAGEYINIVNFLYDLEDDDELSFEIRDYEMTSGNATFTVYNIPIESSTLIESSTTSSDVTSDDTITNTTTSTDSATSTAVDQTTDTTDVDSTGTTDNTVATGNAT